MNKIILPLILIILMHQISFASDLDEYKKYGHKSPKWSPLIEAGFEADAGGNTDTAITFFKKGIQNGCRDGLVLFKLAIFYESNDDLINAKLYFEEAKKDLLKRYSKITASKKIFEHLGRVLFSLGENDSAKKELLEALNNQGENFSTFFLLGSIAKKENNDQKIIYYYSKALDYLPPKEIPFEQVKMTILVEIGAALYNLKQYDESLSIWNQILQIYPKHPIAARYRDIINKMKMNKQKNQSEKQILEEFVY